MTHTPLGELEIFELFIAAYPDLYADQEEDDALWARVIEHADDVFSDPDEASDFLGRVVMLTNPMRSEVTGQRMHVLGKVSINGNEVSMQTAVCRPVNEGA